MNKGISGIGVLIIFIAMILVAAVAAMVLLQTVGSLEGQALQTGKESTTEVSTKLRIVSITGVTDSPTSPTQINYLRAVVKLAPGSGNIDLNSTIMSFITSIAQDNVQYNKSASNTEANAQIATINGLSFSAVYLGEASGFAARDAVTSDDTVEIWYELSGMSTNTDFRIGFIPTGGAPEEIPSSSPAALEGQYVKIFP